MAERHGIFFFCLGKVLVQSTSGTAAVLVLHNVEPAGLWDGRDVTSGPPPSLAAFASGGSHIHAFPPSAFSPLLFPFPSPQDIGWWACRPLLSVVSCVGKLSTWLAPSSPFGQWNIVPRDISSVPIACLRLHLPPPPSGGGSGWVGSTGGKNLWH